jgi:nicotinamide mononucleotide transporter
VDITAIAEIIAVIFGIAGVWLTIRQSVWCWPVGLVNVSLFAFVFFGSRLYGSAALQLVYVVISAYGWYKWLHPGDGGHVLLVSRTPRRWWLPLSAIGLAFGIAFGVFLRERTDAALPFVDAATTAFSLIAQWMITRKWIENWLIWIAVDTAYVGMYLSQRLYPTAALYAVFLVLAVFGYREWQRSMAHRGTMVER